MAKSNGKVIAVIPAYNEEKFIEKTINSMKAIPLIDEIIVVDDGSKDKTAEKARDTGVKVISLTKNCGKGFAIRKAIENIEYEYVVLVDGDLGKSSEEVNKLIKPVLNGEADVTIAKFKKAKRKGGFGLVKNLAKYGVYIYTRKKIDTTLSGQRVYKKEVMDNTQYIPDRFGIEVAMTINSFKKGFKVKEVEVDMTHRETGRNLEGFIHRGKQFFDILKTLIILLYKN